MATKSAIAPGLHTPWEGPGSGVSEVPQKPAPNARPFARVRPNVIFDRHHYAKFAGETLVSVSNAVPGTLVMPAPDTRRNALMIRNVSASANVYIAFGSYANTKSIIYLEPNIMMLFDVVVPQDDVYALADAASAELVIAQSVIP